MAEIKIVGRQIFLHPNRSVFVGFREGTTDVFVQIARGGFNTRIRLSADAAIALRTLLYRHDDAGEPRSYTIIKAAPAFVWAPVEDKESSASATADSPPSGVNKDTEAP